MERTKFFHRAKYPYKRMRGKKVVDMVMQDATGKEIVFPDLKDSDVASVGAIATIDEKPFSGEYVMPNGSVFKFSIGKLIKIIPPVDYGVIAPKGVSSDAAYLANKLQAVLNKVIAQKKALDMKNSVVTVKKEIRELSQFMDTVERDRGKGSREYLASKTNKSNPTATPDNRFAGILNRIKNIKRKNN